MLNCSWHLEDLGIIAGAVVDEVSSVILDVPSRRVGVTVDSSHSRRS
jgi:hypothetical protein